MALHFPSMLLSVGGRVAQLVLLTDSLEYLRCFSRSRGGGCVSECMIDRLGGNLQC